MSTIAPEAPRAGVPPEAPCASPHGRCTRCHFRLRWPLLLYPLETYFPRIAGETYRRQCGGVFVIREGEVVACYCPACAEDLQICRICGCTEEIGCPEGCHWVEENVHASLCSRCRVERAA